MNKEKYKILEMIETGKIPAAKAIELLEVAENQVISRNDASSHSLCIRITTHENKNVAITIPLFILKFTTKLANMGLKYIPEEARQELKQKGLDLAEIDFDELALLLEQGLIGSKLISLEKEDPVTGRTKIEVSIQ